MVVKPKSTLKRIRQVADDVLFGDGDLGAKDRYRAGKENLSHPQCPCTKGRTYNPIKIIMGDDLFITCRRIHNRGLLHGNI